MNRLVAFLLLLLSLLLSLPGADAAPFQPFDGPRPLAVLIETSPWRMVLCADPPKFVLYEDGQVIYRKDVPDAPTRYLWKRLTPQELQRLKATLAGFGPFRHVDKLLELADISDQPETKLYLNFDQTRLATTVYGMNVFKRSPEDGRSAVALPLSVRRLYVYLAALELPGATPWTPAYVEAMAWDYSYATQASIAWPRQWPGLHAPTTIRRADMYSIFIPGTQKDALAAFLATQRAQGAVDIDGKKFSVSVRSVFPGEPVWRQAFARE